MITSEGRPNRITALIILEKQIKIYGILARDTVEDLHPTTGLTSFPQVIYGRHQDTHEIPDAMMHQSRLETCGWCQSHPSRH